MLRVDGARGLEINSLAGLLSLETLKVGRALEVLLITLGKNPSVKLKMQTLELRWTPLVKNR